MIRAVPGIRARPLAGVYGFDQPVTTQYVRFVAQAARGNFGYSIAYDRGPLCGAVLARRALPNTLLLMTVSLYPLSSLAWGSPWASPRQLGLDRYGIECSAISRWVCTRSPEYWLAQLALLTFAVWLPIFPAGGVVDPVLHPYLGPAAAFLGSPASLPDLFQRVDSG